MSIPLSESTCFLYQLQLPEEVRLTSEQFDVLWNSHPVEKGVVKILGKDIQTPRWQQSFLRPYFFSGKLHGAAPLDNPSLQKVLSWAQQHAGVDFNQLLVNWYDVTAGHYIGKHSDSEKQLVEGAPIYSFSFGTQRTFRVRHKYKKDEKIDLLMPDNSLVVMAGDMQKFYTHEVPVSKKYVGDGRRINITTRLFR